MVIRCRLRHSALDCWLDKAYLFPFTIATKENYGEKNISTEQNQKEKDPRISCPPPHPQWPRRPAAQARQGAQEISALGLGEEHRLRKRNEFLAGYEHGRRHHTRHFIVFVRPHGDSQGPWRLGITVSGKVGSAVCRNRIKRLVREYFRLNRELIPAGHDYVVVAKRGVQAKRLTLAGVENDLKPLLHKIESGLAHKPGADTGP